MAKTSKEFDDLVIKVAAGQSIIDAAAEVGCTIGTAYHYSRQPDFKAAVSAIRTEATYSAVGVLSTLAVKAVQTLESVMDDPDSRPSDRISAAKVVLEKLNDMSQLHELRQRIDELERKNQEQVQ